MLSDDDVPIDDEYNRQEQTEGRGSSQIFAMAWVKQKAAKLIPDRIQLSKEELKNLFEQGSNWDAVDGESSDAESMEEPIEGDDDLNTAPQVDDDLKEFDFENYDEEPDDVQAESLSSLAVFPCNDDDPYMSKKEKDQSDSDSEEDAINLRDDDNLLVCARCEKDFASLEVFVYNRTAKDFYVHHDIVLTVPPLCMEWLDFDSGGVLEEGGVDKGNFVAVGNMDSVIEVWDLDVINSVEPAYCLGVPKLKQKKFLLSGGENVGHTEAVLDLSWTPLAREKLSSGSADRLVALWDLEKLTMERKFKAHKEKVQTLAWKPDDQHCLLSGAFDGRVIALDTRSSNGHSKWRLKDEIERVAWRNDNSAYFVASTNVGTIHYCDVRKPMTSVYNFEAHDGAVPALSMTSSLLHSGGSDGFVKVWNLGECNPQLVEEKEMNMGMVHCFQCNPDVPGLLAIGGQKGGVRLWSADWLSGREDSADPTTVSAHFNACQEPAPFSHDDVTTTENKSNRHDVIQKKAMKNNQIEESKKLSSEVAKDVRKCDVNMTTNEDKTERKNKLDATKQEPKKNNTKSMDASVSVSKVEGNKNKSKRKKRKRRATSNGEKKVRLYPKQRRRMMKKST